MAMNDVRWKGVQSTRGRRHWNRALSQRSKTCWRRPAVEHTAGSRSAGPCAAERKSCSLCRNSTHCSFYSCLRAYVNGNWYTFVTIEAAPSRE